jgi:predicted acetyltransferase
MTHPKARQGNLPGQMGERKGKMKLVLPSKEYKAGFLAFTEELRNEAAGTYRDEAKVTEEDFRKFVKGLEDNSKGINLPDGYVPATTYWLIDDDEFIGRVSVRHELTDNLMKFGGHIGYLIRPSKRKMGYGTTILKLGLEKAKELGINKILVTCDETNIASRKIIEKNGGIFENKLLQTEGPAKLRFWIIK